jgi:fucose 4-O-acetylase-like acetyltransferase
MEKVRLKYFDFVSGLFMIQIIVLHILQFSGNYSNQIFTAIMHILFFFMPWFYFKSGYLYSSPKNGTKSYIHGKVKSLLIPFVIFTLIGFLLSFPFDLLVSNRSIWRMLVSPVYAMIRWGNGGNSNIPIWFLLSLFFSLTGFVFLDKFRIKWFIIFFPLAGYALYYFNYNQILPLGLANLFLGIFYLYAGYLFRTKIENSRYSTLFLCLAAVIYGITQIFYFSSLDMRIDMLLSGNYFLYVLSGLCGLALIYYLGEKINYFKPVNYIGENSMVYFIMHWPILLLVKNSMESLSLKTSGYVYAGILSFIVFLVLPICVKGLNGKFKFLIGK